MHRHCIRAFLSQRAEPACRSFLKPAQRLFSTPSAVPSSTPTPPRRRPNSPSSSKKTTPYIKKLNGRRSVGFRSKPEPEPKPRPTYKYKKIGPRRKFELEYMQRRPPYRNRVTFDSPLKLKETKVRRHVPIPQRFINPEPLRATLVENEKKAFVAGQDEEELDIQAQDVDTEFAEELALMANFTPGTFVEIRRNERSTEAIVLGDVLKDRAMRVVCLTATGEIMDALVTNIFFSIPNLISVELAKRCGKEILPETPQARNARVEALKQLRLVTIQAEQAAQGSRMWDRQKIANLYEILKHSDPSRWSTITLEHATSMLYTLPGYINYYATHRYLMERPLRYIADAGYIRSQQFRVRPQRDIDEIQTVENWIKTFREYPFEEGPYKSFVAKARRLLDERGNKPLMPSGPMSQKDAKEPWSEDHQVVLSFLLRSLQKHTSSQKDPYQMGRNTIVSDVTRKTEVTDDAIHILLIKLGVIAPWQDLFALSPQLNPTTDYSTQFPMEKEAEAILHKSSFASTNTVLGPMDFNPRDPLDSVRHDFGDARVFVIDDPDAKELDDGVSVERIPSEPENHWIHVHIADPARILHPGHALSHRARDQLQSIYFPSGNYPMLPPTLMHDPKYGLSLTDSSSENCGPNYVLTFSAKLDAVGNILEHKLRAGILRNVRIASYDDVDAALGEEVPPKIYPYGKAVKEISNASFSESEVADLRLLKKLADAQVAKRVRAGVVVPERPSAEVKFKTKIPAEIRSPCLSGSEYSGFPEMIYTVGLTSIDDQGARNMVSEAMKLGCRIASRVALDHNLPFIRRCLQPFVWKSDADLQAALNLRDRQGYIPMQEFVKFDMYPTSGYYSQDADTHSQLGLPAGEGYSRATSPLRRYMDLVLHWQLHHVLLGPNAPPRPPFSSEEIEKLIIEGSIKDLQVRRLHKANHAYYALMYIKKWRYDWGTGFKPPRRRKGERGTHDPIALAHAWTLRQPVRDNTSSICCAVALPALGIDAELKNLPHHYLDLPTGSDLMVKFHSIQLGLRRTKLVVVLA